MSLKEQIQDAMKEAMKSRDTVRLETLRMAKGALLLKEKESADDLTDEVAIAALRAEVRKREQTAETFRQLGKEAEAKAAEAEIAVIQEFLPKQLDRAQVVERVRAYLAQHPEMNHAGKLTGAIKKELGDQVDGKVLNEVCREVLPG